MPGRAYLEQKWSPPSIEQMQAQARAAGARHPKAEMSPEDRAMWDTFSASLDKSRAASKESHYTAKGTPTDEDET
jgi:hypothetical protein